jgi:hypothetical protein
LGAFFCILFKKGKEDALCCIDILRFLLFS